jgi:hypothetical protein
VDACFTECRFHSAFRSSSPEHSGHSRRNCTGIPTPDLSEVEGVACRFRQSRITDHSPLLSANRGYAELEMVPTPCKQRAITLSNRGEIRVVQALRRQSRALHPSSLPVSHPYALGSAGCPIVPESQGRVGIETHRTGPPASNFQPPISNLIATRTYSPEKLTPRKTRVIRFSNRHKIHFVLWPNPAADRARSSTLPYRNHACTERSKCEAIRCLH